MKFILLAAPISSSFRTLCIQNNFSFIEYVQGITEANHTIEGIITSNKLNLDAVTLSKFTSLKWVARLGSGMEIIDTAYCDQHMIRYFSSPKGIANAVAEHMMGMLLSLLHQIPFSYNDLKNGNWNREQFRGNELENLNIGIIGYGHTGSAFSKKAAAFTPNILVYDKYKKNFGHNFIQEVSLEELKQKADIISFHLPLNNETMNYYNQEFCNSMSKPHILLNSARGGIAHSNVILEGLKQGKIIGACLDVLSEESNIQYELNRENNLIQQLLNFPVIITPHIAGYSHNAIEKMSTELMKALIQYGFLTL